MNEELVKSSLEKQLLIKSRILEAAAEYINAKASFYGKVEEIVEKHGDDEFEFESCWHWALNQTRLAEDPEFEEVLDMDFPDFEEEEDEITELRLSEV